MAKIKKLIKPLVYIALIVLLGVCMINIFKQSKAKIHGKLLSYSYSYGGDMIGSYRSKSVKRIGDGKAFVSSADSRRHYLDSTISEYYISDITLDKIEEIADKYKLYTYNDLPKSKLFAYDAGTSSYSFNFENLSLGFSSSDDVPVKGWDAIREIDKVISEAISEGEKLPGLVLEQTGEDYNAREVKKGTVYVEVFEYSKNYIHYRIKNGLEENVEVKNDNTIYLIDNENRHEIAHTEGKYARELPAYYCEDEYIEIKEGRLQPGEYVLVAGEYETTFSIE